MGQTAPRRGAAALSPPQINRLITQAAESKDVDYLAQVVHVHLPNMNVVNISTSLYRFGKLASDVPSTRARLSSEPAVTHLVSAAYSAIAGTAPSWPSPQAVSNIAWSLASLQRPAKDLLALLARVGVATMSGLKHFELSSMLWAFAKLGCHTLLPQETATLFNTAREHLKGHLGELQMRSLSNLSWAFATAKLHPEGWFQELAEEILRQAPLARCLEISNIMWAFGAAGHKAAAMMEALGDTAVLRLSEFRGQEISNTLWGFATNSVYHAAFFKASVAAALRMTLNSQQLANILWACARTRPRLAATWDAAMALLPRCADTIGSFKPLEAASVLMAASRIFGRLGDEDSWKGTCCSVVLRFHSAMSQWAISRTGSFSIQSLANILSALTTLGLRDDAGGFWAALEAEVVLRTPRLCPSGAVLLLRSLLIDPSPPSPAARALAAHLCRSFPLRPNDMASLRRIFMCHAMACGTDPSDQELLAWCHDLSRGEVQCVPPHATQHAPPGVPQPDGDSECVSDDGDVSTGYSVKNTFIDCYDPELSEMRRKATLFRSVPPPKHEEGSEDAEEEEEEEESPRQWTPVQPEFSVWKQTPCGPPTATAAASMEPIKVEPVSIDVARMGFAPVEPPPLMNVSIKNTFIEVGGTEADEETELLTTEVRSRAFTFWSERTARGPRYVRQTSHEEETQLASSEAAAEDVGISSAPLGVGLRCAPNQAGAPLTLSRLRQKLRHSFAKREEDTKKEDDDIETTLGQFSPSEGSRASDVSFVAL